MTLTRGAVCAVYAVSRTDAAAFERMAHARERCTLAPSVRNYTYLQHGACHKEADEGRAANVVSATLLSSAGVSRRLYTNTSVSLCCHA